MAQRLALLLLQCAAAYAVAASFKDAGASGDLLAAVATAAVQSHAVSQHAIIQLQPGPLTRSL